MAFSFLGRRGPAKWNLLGKNAIKLDLVGVERPNKHNNFRFKVPCNKNNFLCVSNFMSISVVISFNTSLHVSGDPCPASGDILLPGQPLW
jgi:hypothetical protein